MVRTVVLPGCIDGVITGCILSAGRILGESAALLYTAGFAHVLNGFFFGLASSGASLTVAMYVYAKDRGEFAVAFAIAAKDSFRISVWINEDGLEQHLIVTYSVKYRNYQRLVRERQIERN